MHKHNASVDSYNKITGRVTQTVGSDALCPTYGFVYQPDEHTSLYASHSENFDKGTIVASKYANAGEVLNPAKTKQNEIGFKYANAGFLTSLGILTSSKPTTSKSTKAARICSRTANRNTRG